MLIIGIFIFFFLIGLEELTFGDSCQQFVGGYSGCLAIRDNIAAGVLAVTTDAIIDLG